MPSTRSLLIVGGSCVLLFLLWLPGLRYPILSDTAFYAILGENLWTGEGYTLFGVPYAKHLPLHAFVSFPLIQVLGYSFAMKVSTLLAGWAVLISVYLLLRREMGEAVALGTVVLLSLHHGFALMTQLGSADLLFSALFLFSVFAYGKAASDSRWYFDAFLLAGLASLTRYNGLPLFPLFLLHGCFFRRGDVRRASFWVAMVLGTLLFSLWPLRNFLVFGNPLHSEYTAALPTEAWGFLEQFLSNVLYYLHPAHNLLPILLLFAIIGIFLHGKRHGFLIAAMLASWVLSIFWTTQAMRFMFPGYVILLGFGVLGITSHVSRLKSPVFLLAISLIILSNVAALCLYTFGACNAWFDRTIGWIPSNLHITSEGFHAWDIARQWIRSHAEPGATIILEDSANAVTWDQSVFRDDLVIATGDACPAYRIAQTPWPGEEAVFTTEEEPKTSVVVRKCL